ncbi:MAG: hydantoinase B/oxoprolinase family protein, partial [Planctomycetes bacterium]|nr:hydantoinase B/oxoprolinase family protein [Planctomycetota bacterium]
LNPAHERQTEELLKEAGFKYISSSAQLSPMIRHLPRAQTATVDAYVGQVIGDYLNNVARPIGENGTLHIMTSAGGLVRRDAYRAKDSLLSGPAGGVAGAAAAGRDAGFAKVIGFDMGGTSTDVSRYDGDFEYVFEHRVGDAELLAPALAIETVAAGGGSICWYDAGRLRVGPQSAGANPGPACYGKGGPLTITDVNLLLGRLDPAALSIPIDSKPAREALRELMEKCEPVPTSEETILEGLIAIADERMADAIGTISLRKGYDPREYALVAFGGAGGLHACGVAERLGISDVVVPADAGLLSAYGLGLASIERFAERQVLRPLSAIAGELDAMLTDLGDRAAADVRAEGVAPHRIAVKRRIVSLRLAGQDTPLAVDYEPGAGIAKLFERQYHQLYGRAPVSREIEVESLRVVAAEKTDRPALTIGERGETAQRVTAKAFAGGAWIEARLVARDALETGKALSGPAVVYDAFSTTWVAPGWTLVCDERRTLRLARTQMDGMPATISARSDAVSLELFAGRFESIARDMGEVLRRTALSTNIKERLDFSCALLDERGYLVVNAPHIPVHLGALGLCVREVAKQLPMNPGDTVATNHPAFGGSHLPDITLISPVYDGGTLLGYVASRAHHAELGGALPGSMPPDARTLAEEGVVIPPTYLTRNGAEDWETIRRILTRGPHPSRAPDDNIADLGAALSANLRGVAALTGLARLHGADTVSRAMAELKGHAERRIRQALGSLPDGRYQAIEHLDDGTPLAVKIDVHDDTATIDFAGTGGVHPGNLNATPAIVSSVVIYVLRLLLDQPLPLNEGLMDAVTLPLPRNCILNPDFPPDPAKAPAVVGGNIETSQRLVDTLLKALGLAACSQGTMNNVLFGNGHFSYYETVGGGSGATARGDGASAVQCHMTNTRITDAEVMEHRYPVRIRRFAVRRGSGGGGVRRGGDGIVREIEFLEAMSLSLLGQHRIAGPYGLKGGESGTPARQILIRAGGERVELSSSASAEVKAGDCLILETPGGGGWGRE